MRVQSEMNNQLRTDHSFLGHSVKNLQPPLTSPFRLTAYLTDTQAHIHMHTHIHINKIKKKSKGLTMQGVGADFFCFFKTKTSTQGSHFQPVGFFLPRKNGISLGVGRSSSGHPSTIHGDHRKSVPVKTIRLSDRSPSAISVAAGSSSSSHGRHSMREEGRAAVMTTTLSWTLPQHLSFNLFTSPLSLF